MGSQVTIRSWEVADRDAVQALLSLLATDAAVVALDAPTYSPRPMARSWGWSTVCVFTTLTGRKAFVDHLVVACEARRRGVARLLMRHAIEVADAAGASRIDLSAND